MSKLKRLTIDGFRGSSRRVEFQFDTKKNLVLIFGENGSGKTTIADALDVLGNLTKGSLDDKSTTRSKNQLANLNRKPKEVRIELESDSGNWTGTLKGAKIQVAPEPLPVVRVLRRSNLMRLVEAQPADRYNQLKRFIEVERIERSENELKEAVSHVERLVAQYVKKGLDTESKIETFWQDNEGDKTPIQWAAELASSDASDFEQQVTHIRNARTALETAIKAQQAQQTSKKDITTHEAALREVEQEIAKKARLEGTDTVKLADILNRVSTFLARGAHPDACPVCEQPIPLDKLRQDVSARVASLQAVQQLGEKLKAAQKKLEFAKKSFLEKEQAYQSAIVSLFPFVDMFNGVADTIGQALVASGSSQPLSTDESHRLVQACAETSGNLADEERRLNRMIGLQAAVKVEYQAWSEARQQAEGAQKLLEALQKTHEIVRTTRIDFTQQILDDIADECNRLYARIHPDEGIGLTRLELERGKRASVHQSGYLEGHEDITPQAYFSESHLDTLGFCSWLALAKRECPDGNAVLVLDDVFTSVDENHLSRLYEMIVEESDHFNHIIATTHQRLLYKRFRGPHGPGKSTQLIKLGKWSMVDGISSFEVALTIEELERIIREKDLNRRNAANLAGILLESVLDALCLQYGCKVKRNADNTYTLNELLDSTTKLFKKLELQQAMLDEDGAPIEPVDFATASPTTLFDKIRPLTYIRNVVGAHHNEDAADIPDNDVRTFATLAIEMVRMLTCAVCGQIATYADGSHFRCSCKKPVLFKMTPLKFP